MDSPDFLVIDDEPSVGRLVRRIAEGCGYSAEVTSDAEAFKRIYTTCQIRVIVVDLMMPQVDGVEILRFLADAECRAHVLIISGYDRRVLETAWRLGEALGLKMAGAISKPMQIGELRSLFETLKAA